MFNCSVPSYYLSILLLVFLELWLMVYIVSRSRPGRIIENVRTQFKIKIEVSFFTFYMLVLLTGSYINEK